VERLEEVQRLNNPKRITTAYQLKTGIVWVVINK